MLQQKIVLIPTTIVDRGTIQEQRNNRGTMEIEN